MGVNYYQQHIDPSKIDSTKTSGSDGNYSSLTKVTNSKSNDSSDINVINQNGNGMAVSLPLTVWFKVDARKYVNYYDENDQLNVGAVPFVIRYTALYYKIIPRGMADDNDTSKWRIARSITMPENSTWNLDFEKPVKLFGTNTITKKMIEMNGDTISPGDSIIIVWHFTDAEGARSGIRITPGNVKPKFTVSTNDNDDFLDRTYAGGYKAPYVMKVLYNGATTPGR